VPAFRLQGKVIAGFAAFKNHLSYLPHSGSVFPELGDTISHYKTSSGALQFPVDRPLPKALVKKLIARGRASRNRASPVIWKCRQAPCSQNRRAQRRACAAR
jgi:uncharacterized protein YdhG (YjbR/CyaY superfamily)